MDQVPETSAKDQAPETPATPKRQQMTRDQRLHAQHLRNLGWRYRDIASHLGKTERSIQVACTGRATPGKRSGRPRHLSPSQLEELIGFVQSSQRARLMPLKDIPKELGWDVSAATIRRALAKAGFNRARAAASVSSHDQHTRHPSIAP